MDKLKKGLVDMIRQELLLLEFGEVAAIDKDKRTIDVKPLMGGANIMSVNLQSKQAVDTGICLFPTQGSHVVVGFFDKNTACVLLAEQYDQIIIDDDVAIEINCRKEKISIKNAETSLLTLLSDLISLLKTQYQVSTPAGPSAAILPSTEAALNNLETEFKKLLK